MKTADQIRAAIAKAGLAPEALLIADDYYRLIRADWIRGGFVTALRGWLQTFNSETWRSDGWDCDDFCLMAALLVRQLHRHHSAQKSSPAFGWLWYDRRGQGLHAINFAVTGSGIIYHDPTLQAEVTLTETEVKSCCALYI
jgi:hypothetical protein